jgi:hypothetical protein
MKDDGFSVASMHDAGEFVLDRFEIPECMEK